MSYYFSDRPYFFTYHFTWFDEHGNSGVLPIEADTLKDAMRVFYELRGDQIVGASGRRDFVDVKQVINAIAN